MVRATTSLETTRHDLKSVEGGWIELRPMTYDQFLQRQDMGMKMGVSGSSLKGLEKLDLEMVQTAVTRFEFKTCVADHNLDDENGRKLSFGNPTDFAKLDPKIGQEISELIDEMIQWERPKRDGEPENGDRENDTVPEDSEP